MNMETLHYLVADLGRDVFHPRWGSLIYRPSYHEGHRYFNLYSQTSVGGELDVLMVYPGEILVLNLKNPPLDSDGYTFFDVFQDGFWESMRILKRDVLEYLKLGILIPLDEAGVLAHEYGIL